MVKKSRSDKMNASDIIAFGKMMALFQDVYVPGKPISSTKVQLYFDMLSEVSIEELAIATEHIIRTKKYATFPLVPEILEAIGVDEKKDDETEALESWEKFVSLVENDFGFGPTRIDDPVMAETARVAFGSVDKFREHDRDMDASNRKHFISCYRGVKKRYIPPKELQSSILQQLVENRKKLIGHDEREKGGENDE